MAALRCAAGQLPKAAILLGDEAFFELAAAYVKAHPSDHYDIGRYGHLLPSLLRARPELTTRGDAADLAALEWARVEVFQEAHVPPVDREIFGRRFGERPERSGIALVPALRIVRVEHDVVDLFRRLDEEQRPGRPARQPAVLAVWRPRLAVFHTRLGDAEAAALDLARDGASVAEICAAFGSAPDPAHAAFSALSSWLDEGFIANVSVR